MKANSIEEFFGTLQQSVIETWRDHLETSKYSKHMALDEYYKEMPELVDTLIEDWQGINGKIENYKNILEPQDMDAIEYLNQMHELVKSGREDFLKGESELESDADAILSLIDSTLYKVKELKEGLISLADYLLYS